MGDSCELRDNFDNMTSGVYTREIIIPLILIIPLIIPLYYFFLFLHFIEVQ